MPDQHEEFSRLLFPHVLDLSPRMSTWTLILFVSLVQHFVQQQWGSQNKLSTCESTTMSFQLQSRLSSQQHWLYNKFFAENKMSSFKNIRDVREPTMALWKSEVTLPQLNIVATKTLNNNEGGVLWQLNEFQRTNSTEDQFNSMVTEDCKATHVLSGSLNMPVFEKLIVATSPMAALTTWFYHTTELHIAIFNPNWRHGLRTPHTRDWGLELAWSTSSRDG